MNSSTDRFITHYGLPKRSLSPGDQIRRPGSRKVPHRKLKVKASWHYAPNTEYNSVLAQPLSIKNGDFNALQHRYFAKVYLNAALS